MILDGISHVAKAKVSSVSIPLLPLQGILVLMAALLLVAIKIMQMHLVQLQLMGAMRKRRKYHLQ
jgi:hypothetical protein